MTKTKILSEIKRTAAANEDMPLGMGRFFNETGIKKTDWYGKYWARWNDAVQEAGFLPNRKQESLEFNVVIMALVNLTRDLGRFPVVGDLRLKAKSVSGFPSDFTFRKRIGDKRNLMLKVVEFCRTHDGFEDVAAICERDEQSYKPAKEPDEADTGANDIGFVYLLKSGRHYKIGRSIAVGQRERQLQIQLPERANIIHEIRTDDPIGIEEYWHKRFREKRKNGEWFELDQKDISAFRRRKFM